MKILGWPWDQKEFQLKEDYVWDSRKKGVNLHITDDKWNLELTIVDGVWHIKKGFFWDGTTWVPDGPEDINKPGYPITWKASLIHDVGYISLRQKTFYKQYSRKEIDIYFQELLEEVGYNIKLYYNGVRLFGGIIIKVGKIKRFIECIFKK